MEQDIISMLYHGKIAPWESEKRTTPRMERLREQIGRETDRLEQLLDEEGKRLLEQLQDDSAELEGQMICEGFRNGFRTGAQLMLAAMGITAP